MKKKMVPLLAILAIVGSAVMIYRTQFSTAQKFDLNPYQALGAGVAEETAKLLGKKGSVLVVSQDTSEFRNDAIEGQLSAFQKMITKSGVSIASILNYKLKPMDRMATGGAVTRDQFLELLQSNPNAGAVVLFCGFPPLAAGDYEMMRQRGLKFVLVSGYSSSIKKFLEAQVIHLAVIPQFETPPATAKTPKTLREWFERDYLVITPETTKTLPY